MEMKLHPHHAAVTAIQYSANGERGQHVQPRAIVCCVFFFFFPQLGSVTFLNLLQVT